MRRFHAHNAQRGAFSQNWNSTWTLWCVEFKRRKAKEAAKAPPRVEVSKGDAAYGADRQGLGVLGEKLYAQTGRWNPGYGPEPTSPACKWGPDILAKHIVNYPEQIPVLAARAPSHPTRTITMAGGAETISTMRGGATDRAASRCPQEARRSCPRHRQRRQHINLKILIAPA